MKNKFIISVIAIFKKREKDNVDSFQTGVWYAHKPAKNNIEEIIKGNIMVSLPLGDNETTPNLPSSKKVQARTSNLEIIHDPLVVNKIDLKWVYRQGISEQGDSYEPEKVDINIRFHNMPKRSNGNVFTFLVDAKDMSYTIDLRKMIEEGKIIHANIDGGFTINSTTIPKLP